MHVYMYESVNNIFVSIYTILSMIEIKKYLCYTTCVNMKIFIRKKGDLTMNFFDIFATTLSNERINSAIISSVVIILLGYFLRRKKIFDDQTAKVLTKVVLSVSVAALAFNSFMAPIKPETFTQGLNVLIWGILIYVLLIFVTIPLYHKYEGDEKDTLRVLSIFGSTTFFGIPIVSAIYGAEGALYASIFNIGYRIFLYSYGYIKMSGLKMTTKNLRSMFLNPIVIATFLGLFLWLAQGYLPQVTVAVTNASGEVVNQTVSFMRLDVTSPQITKILTYLAGLASPLAWLAIGSTLGSVSFKDAMTDKRAIYYTIVKLLIVPAINIVVLVILTVTHILPVNLVSLGTIVIMMATPPATVAASYAIRFDKGALLASNTSLIATLVAVIMAPVWIVVVEMIGHLGIF